MRSRPDHQTVAAYLALALVLITGTAYAAATIGSGDVINGSLRSADLKNNAGVRGADVRNNNLKGADFGPGKLGGADVGDNAIGGAQASEPSIVASRIIARLGGVVNQPIPDAPGPIAFANNTYTQPAGGPNELVGGGQLTFSAACAQPRNAIIYVTVDAAPPSIANLVGIAQVTDNGAGSVTKRFQVSAFFGAPNGMVLPRQSAPAPRAYFLYGDLNCNAGSGATLDSLAIDAVIHQ